MRVFLTGGKGGIGTVIRTAFERNGMEVIAPSSTELDLGNNFDCSLYPEVNGLVHCAGINLLSKHDEMDLDSFSRLFAINTMSFVSLCSKLRFAPRSSIVAIGSLYATETKEERIQYAMSKHALYAAVKTIALEKAKQQIKVNMVSPGFVDTPMTRKNNTEDRIRYLNSTIPLGLVDADQIASLCVYLLSINTAITGQNLIVDGGYSLKGA
jgi:NAD(P)-dependent dehydrogenase (short-subunit alcohol dehydrogenase family)